METLFVARDAQIKQQENTLAIISEGQRHMFPVEKIGHLVMLGEARLNTRLLTLLGKHGVRLSVFDYYGYYKGAFEPIDANPAGKIKLLQAKAILDDRAHLALAREILRGAVHNLRANLLYYHYRKTAQFGDVLHEIAILENRIGHANDTETLMGIEGNIRLTYYAAWGRIDPRLDFGKRIRRPPNNPINCLISFLNQLVYTVVRHELFKTHLEESFGLLHSPNTPGRSSLSLDLAEPFKPPLADQLIFRMVGRNQLADNWFDQQEGVCLLTETGRRQVAEQFALRLEEKYDGRSYREWVYREALAIERHLLEVAEYESFKRKI